MAQSRATGDGRNGTGDRMKYTTAARPRTKQTHTLAGGVRVTISLPSAAWWAGVAEHQNRLPLVGAGQKVAVV